MKREKQYLLDEIKEQLGQSGSYIITQYYALDANKANEFRRELSKNGGHFEVIKKRVFIKAAQEIGVTFTEEALSGHIGLVMTKTDPLELTKAILNYSNANDKKVTLLGGFVEGKALGAKDMAIFATLPAKSEMRAQFLGLLEAPMSQMLSVVQSLLTSVMHCMDNRSSKTE
jgi:large subunit ribosomal protein L10